MKNIYLLLIPILLFTACDDISNNNRNLLTISAPQEFIHKNSTEPIREIKPEKSEVVKKIEKVPIKEYNFIFEDLKNHTSKVTMKDDIYTFSNIEQPIVMVVLFSTWCPPCRGQIPHLSNLQKRFKEELFIIGGLVHDNIKSKEFQKFINAQKALFFISTNQKENLKFANMITPRLRLDRDFPMPLMILFFKGKYFTHYEGAMPEEMIESDIKQLLIKLKKGN